MNKKNNTTFAFALITALFFLWGLIHNLNPILIPHLRKSFTLNITQSTLVDSAVYIAYFLMALPAGYLMKKFGYQAGIITGLLLFATGSFLFIPAANTQSYDFFLIALFVIACGLTILETAANPYASALGRPETSTQRLNFAQSFNGLAAALAPVIGARVILTRSYSEAELAAMTEPARKIALASEASSVKTPYLILGAVLVLVAIAFSLTKLPNLQSNASTQRKGRHVFQAFRHSHLTWAVIAQFFYVGAQVSVFSLFILFATYAASVDEIKAADFLGACGIAFLVGRFIGTYLMKYIKPNKLLALYAIINVFLCIVAIAAQGMVVVYAVILMCFFMSIMFPTIFALGIKNLGEDTEYGSGLIIMSIVGGAVFPRIFGYIADTTGNIQQGYIVPMICFVVIAYFGWRGYKVTGDVEVKTQPALS